MRNIIILVASLWSMTEGQVKLLLPHLQFSPKVAQGQFSTYSKAHAEAHAEAGVQLPNNVITDFSTHTQPHLFYGSPPYHPESPEYPQSPQHPQPPQHSQPLPQHSQLPQNSQSPQHSQLHPQHPQAPQHPQTHPQAPQHSQPPPPQPQSPQHPEPAQHPQQENVPSRVSEEDLVNEEWLEFKLAYKKVYSSSDEERLRREIFIENKAKIARHNQEFSKGLRNFVQRMNAYGDMLVHEFNKKLNGFNRTRQGSEAKIAISTPSAFIPSANVDFPECVDWRQLGGVSSVKNQQLCAACWAFAAAGALEGHNFRKTGKLVDVSIQNLLDCTRPFGNEACDGGLIEPAFEYVEQNNGIDSEDTYPYEAVGKNCRLTKQSIAATCTGYVNIPQEDERGLQIAVATLGPVAAALDASRDSLQFYSDGVYYDPECGSKPEQMNHAVLVVGYGIEANGQKYWLVKNSYGTHWGIGGYMKIAKDYGNHCGIATQSTYPLV